MKQNFLIFLIGCSLVFSVVGCQKGGTGPAGATGATGPAGPAGVAGPTGTANVIYSSWATVTFAGSSTSWSASITAPGVTQAILDQGVVKTYFQFGSTVYDGNYNNIPTGHAIYQYLIVGSIDLAATFNATYPWRYVIIPGGVAGGRTGGGVNADTFVFQDGSTMLKSDLDKMSYEDVCKRFNIPQ
jgi:hypothetical protein